MKKKEGEHDGSGGAYGAAPHKHRWLHILWSLAVHSAIEGDIYKESHAIPMNSLFTELFFHIQPPQYSTLLRVYCHHQLGSC